MTAPPEVKRITRRSLLLASTSTVVIGQALAKPIFLRGSGPLSLEAPPPPPPPPANADNIITVTNVSGAAVTNYPYQFGRPFVQGEITDFAQVLIDGVAATTQCDAKNRHPDGSLKYAVLAVVIPSLPNNTNVVLTFQNQASGNNTALSGAAMLDAAYDFEATMALVFTSAATGTASARAMLTAGDYTLWTSGPVAQTIELADDTVARAYDLGNGDGFHPFRPRFYATFWPALHKVQIRYVGDAGLTTEITDLNYNLTLTRGNAIPTTVYSLNLTGSAPGGKIHAAMTGWNKTFWLGGIPEQKINIAYNFPYLSATKYLPNYDSSFTIPEVTIASQYSAHLKRPTDPYASGGGWAERMSIAGARDEIGPFPGKTVFWLYSGDWRTREIALAMAARAHAFPAVLFESDPTRRLARDDATPGTGLGRAVSATDRKTAITSVLTYGYTEPGDKFGIVGPIITTQWTFELAHQPDPFFLQYVLTGDPWYLRMMYLWAGRSALYPNFPARGPTGAEGAIYTELRGIGWQTRNRTEAAFAAPDSAPEKHHFTELVKDMLAAFEGGLQISGTPLDGHPVKVWRQSKGNPWTLNGGPVAGQVPPLHNWEANGNPTKAGASVVASENENIYQVGKVGNFSSLWMFWYDLYGFGRAEELGFPTGALLDYSGKVLADLILRTAHPKMVANYQFPVEKLGGGFFPSWDEIFSDAFTADYLNNVLPPYFLQQQQPDGRHFWATPGAAYLAPRSADGAAVWAWWLGNVYNVVRPKLPSVTPKWAIVPRT